MLTDLDKLREHFAGDEELISELAEVFEVSYKDVLSRLEKAIGEDKRDEVKLEAHTMKGMVSNFFAEELRAIAFDLEANAAKLSKEELYSKVETLKEKIPPMIKEIKNAKFS